MAKTFCTFCSIPKGDNIVQGYTYNEFNPFPINPIIPKGGGGEGAGLKPVLTPHGIFTVPNKINKD